MSENGQSPKLSGYLFGRHAFLPYLGGAALAVWYRNPPLIAVCVFLLLLNALILYWRRGALARLEPALALDGERCFAGDAFTVRASLLNGKWLPLVWLEWEFPATSGIAWEEDKRERYVIRFLWVMWHQRLSWTVRGHALRRGVYPLGRIVLRSGDGFRFSESEKNVDMHRTVYVYPRLVPVKPPSVPLSLEWSAEGRRGGLYEDRLLIAGVRESGAGAEWRRVNWKATARTGSLQINLYDPVAVRRLFIYADVRGYAPPPSTGEDPEREKAEKAKLEESFEAMLSVIASLAVSYSRQGVRIGFATNALDEAGRPVGAVEPSALPVPVLDKLAAMAPRAGAAGTRALEKLASSGRLNATLFIFCFEIDEALHRWQLKNRHLVPGLRIFYERDSKFAGRCGGAAVRLGALRAGDNGRAAAGAAAGGSGR